MSRRHSISLSSLVRSPVFLGGLIVVVSSLLIVVHGFASKVFLVDTVTLGLLALAALPFLSTFVSSFKAGGVEFAFRELSVHEQLIAFLDGIATKRQWTFFSPRPGEEDLGPAFKVMTEELLNAARPRLVGQLRAWLASDDVNHRWFAAEIIGYYQLTELTRSVQRAPESTDYDRRWEPWEMNCVWAYSRLEKPPYAKLCAFLVATHDPQNQAWILKSLDQMIEEWKLEAASFSQAINEFASKRGDPAHLLLSDFPNLTPLLQQ